MTLRAARGAYQFATSGARPGTFCALGSVLADFRLDYLKTVYRHASNLTQVEVDDRRGVLAQRLDLDVEARVGGREDVVPLALVVSDPMLPATRCDPEPVNENDGVWRAHRVSPCGSFAAPCPERLRRSSTLAHGPV